MKIKTTILMTVEPVGSPTKAPTTSPTPEPVVDDDELLHLYSFAPSAM